jgi:hypothetical protein
LKFHDLSGTHLAVLNNYNRSDYSLDTRLIYTTTVDVSGYPGFPVVGGGGAYQIVLGENGCLIAFYGVSPKTVSTPFHAKVIPQKDADETFLQLMNDVKLEKYNSSLAYYMAPSFTKQEFLYPVYVYQATAIIGGDKVQLRALTLPATDFGPTIRWHPAFDGLHMLLGYATTSFDNTNEGRLLVQNVKAGETSELLGSARRATLSQLTGVYGRGGF